MNESYIETGPGGTAFVGPDAIRLHRAIYLANSIALHGRCGMIPTRGMTITKMFKIATSITGQTYRRGQHARAIADLRTWIAVMQAALPIEEAR
jgi:hypothetical protein